MRKYLGPVLIIIAAVAVLFGGAIVTLLTDWLWFKDLGYSVIFSRMLVTKLKMALFFGTLFFAIIYSNLWYARRIAPPPSPMSVEQQLIERLGRLARRGIGLLLFLGSIVVSAIVGVEAASHWQEWLAYRHATAFGSADPIFGRDIGFYVFQLPFIVYVYRWLFFALLASAVAAAALHYADEAIEVFGNRLQFAPRVKAHLAILVAAMFALKAWGYRLAMYRLTFGRGELFDGAAYADVHARIPALWILIVVSFIGALLVLTGIFRRGINHAVAALVLLVGASIVIGSGYPAAVQRFTVKPNPLRNETPFIKRAVEATTEAYGLTNIAARDFAAETTLTPEQVAQNDATIENIRLWDQTHLQDAYNQIQTIQQYYNFSDVDVDRYWLASKTTGEKRYRQVWLSARELNQASLPEDSRTWFNIHLQYTHGYGLAMSPVNEISTEGLPSFFVYDIPPKTTVDLKIDRPGVYFGEMTDEHVFVRTRASEFDYPLGAETRTATYEAESGIPVGGTFGKLLFASRFSDINILLNTDIRKQSRLLFRRNVTDRMRTLFPFLWLDQDPYLVVANGRLFWLQDAYTYTDAYPYSQHLDPRPGAPNYVRNSVKIVVDAYTGAVDAYIIQKPSEDPIIKAYDKMFPGAFKPFESMPEELKDHIRYPEDLFRIQTNIFARYHQTDPTMFYRNSDLWDIAGRAELLAERQGDQRQMEPYYVIMKLPNGQTEEFILMSPFIRKNKYNMVAWMCAKCDRADYGRLVLYQFPKDKNVYGPSQIVARANQDAMISQQITLWSKEGSTVSSGNLLVIPIESSLLYVMPLYLESTATKIPELKRVIVALGDRIAMAPTLDEALSQVVGGTAPAPKRSSATPAQTIPSAGAPGAAGGIRQLIEQADAQFNKATEAQRRGDWAEYGRQIESLRQTLERMKAAQR